MNLIEKLYTEWAWRTKTGVPDINNPQDKAILDNLVNELTGPIKKEEIIFEGSDSYDNVIKGQLQKEGLLSP